MDSRDASRRNAGEMIIGFRHGQRVAIVLFSVAVFADAVASSPNAARTCQPGASPDKQLKASLERNGFTYVSSKCDLFGRAYYAFTKGTSNPTHPTNSERVLVVTRSVRDAAAAASFYRTATGRRGFLQAFKSLESGPNPQWSFVVRMTRVSSSGGIVRLEAFARTSPR